MKKPHFFIQCILLTAFLSAPPVFAAPVDKNLWVSGSPAAVAAAIQSGVEWNTRDSSGNTPLIYAVWHNSAEVVKLLLDGGAAPDWRNIRGFTPLMFAALYNRDMATLELLLLHGANVDAVDDQGKTALIHAASHREMARSDAVVTLLEKGADPFVKDAAGLAAYDYAKNNMVLASSAGLVLLARYADPARSPYLQRKQATTEPKLGLHSADGAASSGQGAAVSSPLAGNSEASSTEKAGAAHAVAVSGAAYAVPSGSTVVFNVSAQEKTWLDYANGVAGWGVAIAAVVTAAVTLAVYTRKKRPSARKTRGSSPVR